MQKNTQETKQQRYESKRMKVTVSFNTETESHLIDQIEAIKHKTGLPFSVWVKKMMEQQMDESRTH